MTYGTWEEVEGQALRQTKGWQEKMKGVRQMVSPMGKPMPQKTKRILPNKKWM